MNASAILIHFLYTFGWLSEGNDGCSLNNLYMECVIVVGTELVTEVPEDELKWSNWVQWIYIEIGISQRSESADRIVESFTFYFLSKIKSICLLLVKMLEIISLHPNYYYYYRCSTILCWY